jgi:hypothetical protein
MLNATHYLSARRGALLSRRNYNTQRERRQSADAPIMNQCAVARQLCEFRPAETPRGRVLLLAPSSLFVQISLALDAAVLERVRPDSQLA